MEVILIILAIIIVICLLLYSEIYLTKNIQKFRKIETENRELIEKNKLIKLKYSNLKKSNQAITVLLEKEVSVIKIRISEQMTEFKNEWGNLVNDFNEKHDMLRIGLQDLKKEYEISTVKKMKEDIKACILFKTFWKSIKLNVVLGYFNVYEDYYKHKYNYVKNYYYDGKKLLLFLIRNFKLLERQNINTNVFSIGKDYIKFNSMFCNIEFNFSPNNMGRNNKTYNLDSEFCVDFSFKKDKYISINSFKLLNKCNIYDGYPINWFKTNVPNKLIDDWNRFYKSNDIGVFCTKWNIKSLELNDNNYVSDISPGNKINLYCIDKYTWFFIDENNDIQPYIF